MKFIDGNWLIAKGIEAAYACNIFEYEQKEDQLVLYCAERPAKERHATISLPIDTVTISSPLTDVIKVNITHFAGGAGKKPEFLTQDYHPEVSTRAGDKKLSFKTGSLELVADRSDPFKISYYGGGKYLTGTGIRSFGHMREAGTARTYMADELKLSVGETVYGLGEKFTPFVKNGQVVDSWNLDGGSGTWQSYKNIPFYITNRGYGVFVNSPGKVSFEVESQRNFSVGFSAEGEELEYMVIYADSPKEIIDKYTKLTGRPPLVPAWSMGLWLSTSFTTNYDEETVTGIINKMEELELPLRVFHFDCFWMRELEWCNFKWDERYFKDPKGMLERLKSHNLKICVWINSYIGQKSYLFEEGKKNGYFLKRSDKSVWQDDDWQAGRAIVDFTNPKACEWYSSKLEELLNMGVDCFKTDFGERIPTDAVYYDGSDPHKMHNYYTYLYNECVFNTIKRVKGEKEAVVFARSATVGSQKFPVHWGGDCFSDYRAMAETLRGGLSLGVTGFGYWSHDIGGFEATSTPDIYKRWIQFGLLSSHSRLHGSSSYRVPWNYDEEACEVLRRFTCLKMSLMPYLYAAAHQASLKGTPMARAMFLEFPEDPTCYYLDRQYMLGENLLVAPIFSETGEVSYYLPKGEWVNILTNKKYEGGCWYNEAYDYHNLPLLARQGSIIAVGADTSKPDYDYEDNVIFHCFKPDNNAELRAVIINQEGAEAAELKAVYNNSEIRYQYTGTKAYRILLRNETREILETNAKVSHVEEGILLEPADREVSVLLKD